MTDLIKGWSTYWDASVQVRLVATGDPIATGSLGSVQVAEIWVIEKSSSYASPSAYVTITPTTATPQTCSVSAGSVNIPVNLGTTSSKGLTGPVGTTAGNASFNVRVNCTSNLNVYMTLTDGNNLSNTSDTLTLSPSTSQAKGVGIQVRRGGTPVKFGPASSTPGSANQFSVGTASGGVLDIPFTANYIKTATLVTPGDANAVATYTLSYQ
ncbi:fimbrial protein [Pseudomonas nicosulfuronedens]